jgi:4-diphosphocytidyl-2-C-methyl-D-erythritol kinase
MIIRPVERSTDRARGWQCQTPAKINLFLEVLGRRPDGYHNLDTIMLAIDLTDCLEIYPNESDQLTLELDLSEAQQLGNSQLAQSDRTWDIPTQVQGPQANLVLAALDALRSRWDSCADRPSGVQNRGAHVILKKRIPSQAGLGGGSSDAAAALVLGSLLWEIDYDSSHLGCIASDLGSDINFFLDGHNGINWTARCTQRGQSVQPIANRCDIHGLIVHPPEGCHTAEVFALVRDSIERGYQVRWADEMIECLASGPKTQNHQARLAKLLYNRLDGSAVRTTKWVEQTAMCIARYNTLGQCLSGSGSARFCLCNTRAQAEEIASELRQIGDFRAYPFSTWNSPSIDQQITANRKSRISIDDSTD